MVRSTIAKHLIALPDVAGDPSARPPSPSISLTTLSTVAPVREAITTQAPDAHSSAQFHADATPGPVRSDLVLDVWHGPPESS